MSERRVFITGGAGFIGRWVGGRCVAEGWTVTVLDNFCAGKSENLAEFRSRIQLVEGDLTNSDSIRRAIEVAAPHTIFHLAAHHFIPFCNSHPQETLRVNGEGTYIVL